MIENKFASRLKTLREEKGLSQNKLAKETGISQVAISRWERGLQIPNIDTLIVFAKYFKVSCDYLVGMEDY